MGAKSGMPAPVVESIDHEPCDPKGHKTEVFDARGDGKPAVIKVYDGGHEICRISDINHDGRPDLYEYFDAQGNVRRREADYDQNGIVDSVELFEGGKLVKREYDTTGQHRVDTWDYFDKTTGKRIRRERDTTNDGKVDQWWTWDGDKITIAVDKNGDGQPDPGATLVIDEKSGAAQSLDAKTAPPPAASGSATAPASSAVPEGPPPPTAPPPPAAPAASGSAKPSSAGATPAAAPSSGAKK
jgi:hypothetical protein